jgi:hypothetical protein
MSICSIASRNGWHWLGELGTACSLGAAKSANSATGSPAAIPVGTLNKHLRQTPIHDLHFAECANHDIGWFQVAMDDTTTVRVGHRLANIRENPQIFCSILQQTTSSVQQSGQRLSLHQFHRNKGR